MSRLALSPLAGLARYRSHGDNEAELIAALERARVVGVLDGWVAGRIDRDMSLDIHPPTGHTTVMLWANRGPRGGRNYIAFRGPTPDAARAAAARAIEAGEV